MNRIKKQIDLSKPIEINNDDNVYQIQDKIEEYLNAMRNQKYDFVLKFINDILKKENKSLLKIKNLKKDILLKINVKDIIEKYEKDFQDKKIILKKSDDIIAVIKKVLNIINYKFKKFTIDGNELYSIVDRL